MRKLFAKLLPLQQCTLGQGSSLTMMSCFHVLEFLTFLRTLYGNALTKPFGFIKSIPRTIVKVMAKKGWVTVFNRA